MDIQSHTIARKYAIAFLNYIGTSLAAGHSQILKKAVYDFERHTDYITLLKVPTIFNTTKKKGLLAWFRALEIPLDITKLLDVLIEHQRLFLFPVVLQELCDESDIRNNVEEFSLQATVALDKDQIDSIVTFLEHKTGKHIRITQILNKNLIAGIRLQSDIHVWEYSLRQRLREIAKSV